MYHEVYIINEFLNWAIVKCDMHRSKEFYDDLEFIVAEWGEEEERKPANRLQNAIRKAVIEFCQESRGEVKSNINYVAFLKSFLNPEERGLAVPAHIRDDVREFLGMERVETKLDGTTKTDGHKCYFTRQGLRSLEN